MEEPIENVVLFIIDQTSKKAKRYSQKEMDQKKLGINVDQWVLLKIIQEKNGLSQRELATFSNRDVASITRSLDLLEKRQWIERSSIPENRRQYQLSLTNKGQQFIQDNMDMIYQHRANSMKGISEKEMRALKRTLLKIQENME